MPRGMTTYRKPHMTTSAVSTRTLEIAGMTGDSCVNKIVAALRGISGVMTKAVKVGSASISADQAGTAAAIASINASGFKAHESSHAAGAPAAKMQGQPVPYVAAGTVHTPAPAHTPATQTAPTSVKPAEPVVVAAEAKKI